MAKKETTVLTRNVVSNNPEEKFATFAGEADGQARTEVVLAKGKIAGSSSDAVPSKHRGQLESFGCGIVIVGKEIKRRSLPVGFLKKARQVKWNGGGFEFVDSGEYLEDFNHMYATAGKILVA